MFFQILRIRSAIKEVNADPGHFASNEARDLLIGILFFPALIVFLGLAFLFTLGFTHFLGGPYLFFKIIFFIGLFISFIFGTIIYKLTSVLRQTTKKVVNKVVDKGLIDKIQ